MSADLSQVLAKAIESNPALLMGIFQQLGAAGAPTPTKKEAKTPTEVVNPKERFICEEDLSAVTKKTYSLKESKKKGVYVIIRWINKLNNREMGQVYLYKSDFVAEVNHNRGAGGTKAFNAVIGGGITEYVA